MSVVNYSVNESVDLEICRHCGNYNQFVRKIHFQLLVGCHFKRRLSTNCISRPKFAARDTGSTNDGNLSRYWYFLNFLSLSILLSLSVLYLSLCFSLRGAINPRKTLSATARNSPSDANNPIKINENLKEITFNFSLQFVFNFIPFARKHGIQSKMSINNPSVFVQQTITKTDKEKAL